MRRNMTGHHSAEERRRLVIHNLELVSSCRKTAAELIWPKMSVRDHAQLVQTAKLMASIGKQQLTSEEYESDI